MDSRSGGQTDASRAVRCCPVPLLPHWRDRKMEQCRFVGHTSDQQCMLEMCAVKHKAAHKEVTSNCHLFQSQGCAACRSGGRRKATERTGDDASDQFIRVDQLRCYAALADVPVCRRHFVTDGVYSSRAVVSVFCVCFVFQLVVGQKSIVAVLLLNTQHPWQQPGETLRHM